MRAKFVNVNESAGSKDVVRIKSLRDKAKGDPDKEIQYAENMAKAITKAGKAQARGEAAIFVFQGQNPVSDVFFKRVSELTDGEAIESTASKMPGEKPSFRKWKLPASEIYKKAGSGGASAGFGRGQNPHAALGVGDYSKEIKILADGERKWNRDSAVASLGNVNLMKGSSKYFNIYKTWDVDTTTVEVWKTESGAYKLIFTSSLTPNASINSKGSFKNDQTWRQLFDATMVDYTLLKDMPGLIPFYGRSLAGYTYK